MSALMVSSKEQIKTTWIDKVLPIFQLEVHATLVDDSNLKTVYGGFET